VPKNSWLFLLQSGPEYPISQFNGIRGVLQSVCRLLRRRRLRDMAYTYDQLKGMTVAELREIAAGIQNDAVQGYTQLNKEHLLTALCQALNIDTHTRHKSKVAGMNKAAIKEQMKSLKAGRNAALEAHNHAQLKTVRRQLHVLRRTLRKAVAKAGK
jgi:hypothetical protein